MGSIAEHRLTISGETITYVSEDENFLQTKLDKILSAGVQQ
jgi:hypothetical protein